MSINLRVVEYQTWGRYLSIYTVYRIDVRFKDEEWFVFRRFSEFMDMHNRVMNLNVLFFMASNFVRCCFSF